MSDTESKPQDDTEEEKVDLSCGIWKFRTNVFGRKFSNLYVFAILMSISTMFSRMVPEVLRVQMGSMAKQFNIDNAHLGLIATASTAGTVSTLIWAGHFVQNLHIPVVVGLSGILQGLILALPSILQLYKPFTLEGPSNMPNMTDVMLCLPEANNPTGSNMTTGQGPPMEHDKIAYYLVMVVSVLTGMTTSFHSGFLPSVYLDDNIEDKSKMAIFFGIQSVIMALASPIGRGLSGLFSVIPVDLKDTDKNPKDPRFISAWWLVYLIFGMGVALTSLPVVLLPRRLLTRKQQEAAIHKANTTFAGGIVDETVEPDPKPSKNSKRDKSMSIPKVVVSDPNGGKTDNVASTSARSRSSFGDNSEDVRNRRQSTLSVRIDGPTERRISLTGSMAGGNIAFVQPVKKESQFSSDLKEFLALIKDFPVALWRLLTIPPYLIMLVDIALLAIPMMGIGVFKQLYMTYQYNVPIKDVSSLSAASSAVAGVLGTILSSYLATKVHTQMGYLWIIFLTYGIGTVISPMYLILNCDNEPVYGARDNDFGIPVNTSVLANCSCSPSSRLISCGDDGNTYLSPCYAGCTETAGKFYTDCQLLMDNSTTNHVTPGTCPSNSKCHTNFIIYVMLHGLQTMIESMSSVPRYLFILRLVDPRDRAFAISLFMMVFYSISLASPNIFGGIIDQMCIVKRGEYCMLYDKDKLRYLVSGVDVSTQGMMQISMVIVLILIKVKMMKQNKRDKLERAIDEGKTSDNIQMTKF